MKVVFKDDSMKKLFEKGRDSKEARNYSKGIVKGYRKKINILKSISQIQELRKFRSLCFESLHNYEKGGYSIRINRQYRIIFNILDEGHCEVIEVTELEDYH